MRCDCHRARLLRRGSASWWYNDEMSSPGYTRREVAALAWAARAPRRIELAEMARRRGIPAVCAMVAGANGVEYQGAAGAAKEDSIFRIFSMTKAVTSVAAMQLVERGKIGLDEPAGKYVEGLRRLQVLEGFDAAGQPRLRPARRAVTVRHLLTHTSGFGYEFTSAAILKYSEVTGKAGMAARRTGSLDAPLLFEPGEGWQYGISTDWLGKLIEAVSGMGLGAYLKAHIFEPLGMVDTGFSVAESKWGRLVAVHSRQADGSLKESPFGEPRGGGFESGGGGLLGTAADYVRFMQLFLNGGGGVLKKATVDEMGRNQIGRLAAGRIKSTMPAFSLDSDPQPGHDGRWGLGFFINEVPFEGGRSAGSLAWAGLANTHFWIDRRAGLCAVLMMQVLPFYDAQAMGLLGDFERAVYA